MRTTMIEIENENNSQSHTKKWQKQFFCMHFWRNVKLSEGFSKFPPDFGSGSKIWSKMDATVGPDSWVGQWHKRTHSQFLPTPSPLHARRCLDYCERCVNPLQTQPGLVTSVCHSPSFVSHFSPQCPSRDSDIEKQIHKLLRNLLAHTLFNIYAYIHAHTELLPWTTTTTRERA